METQLQNNLRGMGELAKEIAFTDDVQTYLFTPDPVECIGAIDRASDAVERITERGDNIHSVFLFTRTPRHLYTNPSDRNLLEMLNSALEQYGLLSDISLKNPFYFKFFYLPDEITGELNPYFFSVMSLRWPGRFRLSTCIDPDIAQRVIPSMILQPLAENAFKHGFKDKKKTGRLSIQGRLEDGYILIKVTDNGQGISAERLRELNGEMVCPDESRTRIGLINIAHRLRLLYGGRASIRIEAKLHRYTSVVISIPADALPEISPSGSVSDTAPA